MPAIHPEFDDRTLDQLLGALRARTTGHPDNPGLIACWPGVREDRMNAACTELWRRGHPVFRVPIEASRASPARDGWALRASTEIRSAVAIIRPMTSNPPLHVVPHRLGTWFVRREGDDEPLSEHGSETEAELAATHEAGTDEVIVHDRYERVHAARPARRPRQ